MTAALASAALAAAQPAAANPLASDTSTVFLRQGSVSLPERDRIIDSIDVVDGCGEAPGAGRFAVDGSAADWHGGATMISGSSRYDQGEYIWTDYAYDDAGTGALQYPGEGEALVAAPGTTGNGTPREQRYGTNAADVVELRSALDDDFLYLLVRLNFLNAVDSTVLGLAFDLDGDPGTGFADWPHGASLRTPGTDLFVTAYGECAFVAGADGGESSIGAIGGAIRVGTRENVMELAIPRSLLGGATRPKLAGGAGLWDPAAGAWMAPTLGTKRQNNTDAPAGALAPNTPAVFNLLFRGDETTVTTSADAGGSPRAFQITRQAEVLGGGTSGDYAAELELDRLVAGAESDPMPLRRHPGEKDFTRIYRSRIDAEGVVVGGSGGQYPLFLGRYEPYSVDLPDCYEAAACPWPGERPPTILTVHGGSGNHLELGPQEPPAKGGNYLYGIASAYRALEAAIAPVWVRTLGRGPRPPWHRGYGEADELEALEAATEAYDLDTERRIIAGGSLGGYGTIRLSSIYPDVFTGASAHCPAAFENSIGTRDVGNVAPNTQNFTIDPVMRGLFNVRFRMASGTLDPLVPINSEYRMRDAALAAGLDFRFTEYLAGGHCWDKANAAQPWIVNHTAETVELLRQPRVTRPARVRYVIDPRQYFPGPETMGVVDIRDLGVDYTGAYWVSGLHVRDALIEAAAAGTTPGGPDGSSSGYIDVASKALPGWDVGTEGCGASTGIGTAGNPQLTPEGPTPNSWQCQNQTRGGELSNALDLSVTNFDSATLDTGAAGLDAGAPVTLTARGDGPITLTLEGLSKSASGPCLGSSTADAGKTTLHLDLSGDACEIALD